MSETIIQHPGAAEARPAPGELFWRRRAVLVLFGLLTLRFLAVWTEPFTGIALPVVGSIAFTLLFTGFSLLHASCLLGWRRALVFLAACAIVSWCFEAGGIATGLVYGAYHYGDTLGPKLGGVPFIIPLAWFMMVYAAWIVARLLLQGAGEPSSLPATLARILVAALVMTAWDSVMDPGMARSGAWTWEQGGAYFGVPLQNYGGWIVTTLTVYGVAEWAFRCLGEPLTDGPALSWFGGLPALVYGLMALDRLLLPSLPELRIVAAVGMDLAALLALLRLALARHRS